MAPIRKRVTRTIAAPAFAVNAIYSISGKRTWGAPWPNPETFTLAKLRVSLEICSVPTMHSDPTQNENFPKSVLPDDHVRLAATLISIFRAYSTNSLGSSRSVLLSHCVTLIPELLSAQFRVSVQRPSEMCRVRRESHCPVGCGSKQIESSLWLSVELESWRDGLQEYCQNSPRRS